MGKVPVFDTIVNELSLEDTGTDQLDQCMKFNYNLSRKVPLRYKIIAVGFVRKYSLTELNEKLQEYGCAKLYARNLWEASLLFAFRNGLSYGEWRALSEDIQEIKKSGLLPDDIMNQPTVTMKILREYIEQNSDVSELDLLTKHRTKHLENGLDHIKTSAEFVSYLKSNIAAFSTVREKARYYFCKYLYYYLERKINTYIKIADRGLEDRIEDILDDLSLFQGGAKVKKKSAPAEEIREYLESLPISCGVLYAEFNEFYFGYISLDWMHVLLEQAGDLRTLPPEKMRKLADAARQYDRKYIKMSDSDIMRALDEMIEQQEQELDREASLDSRNRGYQKNRMGENTVRKYLKGEIDLDRTTLICFLLFFGSELTKPARLHIDEERINRILRESGFRELDEYDDFDYFIINYLRSDDPADVLMEEVTRYALSRENFYLYKLYQASRSDDADIKKLMSV